MKNLNQSAARVASILAAAVASLGNWSRALSNGELQDAQALRHKRANGQHRSFRNATGRTKNMPAGTKMANQAAEGNFGLGRHRNGKHPINGIYGKFAKR